MGSGAGEGTGQRRCDRPRVVLSSGPGRIHFYDAARALHEDGVDVRLVTGWAPSPWAERVAGGILRATGQGGLSRRLAARSTAAALPSARVHRCSFADWGAMAAERIERLGALPADIARSWAWQHFGRASARFLRDATVLHVRSGAGSGAIQMARRLGIRVVVDHSLVHPWQLYTAMAADERRLFGMPRTRPDSPFQFLQLADCEAADTLLVNSDGVRESFIAAGYPAARIRVVHLGVADSFIGIKNSWRSDERFRILFTGTFGVRKGALVFLETLRLLSHQGLPYQATVVGPREDAAIIDKLTPRGLSLRFVPTVSRDQLVGYLRDADAYLFPTLAEGCAQSAMEALAAGLPVVTTAACGLPANPGAAAFRIAECTADALSQAIIDLSASEAQRCELGKRGTKLIRENYRWPHYARKVAAVYAS